LGECNTSPIFLGKQGKFSIENYPACQPARQHHGNFLAAHSNGQPFTKSFTTSAFLFLSMRSNKNPGENRANLAVHHPKTQGWPVHSLLNETFGFPLAAVQSPNGLVLHYFANNRYYHNHHLQMVEFICLNHNYFTFNHSSI